MSKNIPKFDVGTPVKITFFAECCLERSGQQYDEFINLHEQGNYGEISPDEKIKNNSILKQKDRKSTRLNSSHTDISRMPSSA